VLRSLAANCNETSPGPRVLMDVVAHEPGPPSGRKKLASHVILILGIVSIAVAMRVYGLNGLFAPGFDEGVYWQTLRTMHAGFGLYDQIFYGQPPLFVLSVYPFYALFGQSIAAARAGIAALSLLGLLGAYMMGKALGGRVGALVAMILLVFTPMYLRQSQILQAEGASTAFLFLPVGAALLWWKRPVGKTAVIFAIVCGATLSIGILTKLLNVTAAVPILMLILWRVWTLRQESSYKSSTALRSILVGFIVALAVGLIALMPFLPSLGALLDQVVSYHLVAKKVWPTDNFGTLRWFFTTNGVLTVAAVIGAVLALLRRDWRVIPLLAWLVTTIAFLGMHVPLWSRHTIVLIPPLIAITVLGLGDLASMERVRESLRARTSSVYPGGLLTGLLVFATVVAGIIGSYSYYRQLSTRDGSSAVRGAAEMAADLRRVTTSDQWIITDEQFVATLADRDTPPSLVDTSRIRITTGYLTTQKLIEAASDPRVHVVLFASDRFALGPTASFHGWVSQHFALIRQYGPGAELWIRY
jgi:4-amino-4-deoxy-L-arabinose transferase-like glycosyltransferase